MGTVYLAEDTQIERQVALKTPHFTEDPTGEQMERFFREARAAGNLRHPHICPIYDFGQIDGRHFITMAYIEGRPLSASSSATISRPSDKSCSSSASWRRPCRRHTTTESCIAT